MPRADGDILDRISQIEAAVLSTAGDIRGDLKELRADVRGVREEQKAHDRLDEERFRAVERRLDSLTMKQTKLEDADASQRIEAIHDARAEKDAVEKVAATRDSQAFTMKHGILIAVLSVVLSACGSIATALLMRGVP